MTDWLTEIETRLECCEGEHYGCAEWGATDVRTLINEVKRLRRTFECQVEATAGAYAELHAAKTDTERLREELHAAERRAKVDEVEIKRLRKERDDELAPRTEAPERLLGKQDELRKAAREYIDTLREQQREALGDGFETFIADLEQSTTGTQRCAEALKRLDKASRGE